MASRFSTPMLVACVYSFIAATAQGATISEDFEGELTDGSAPTGWTLVNAGGSGVYSTTASTGNPGQSGNFEWNGATQTAPGVYLVNSGTAFDARQAISGSFDFFQVENGNDMRISLLVGDVQDGLSNTAGEYIHFFGNERTFGRRARVLDGAGTTLFNGDGNNQYRIDTGIWISADFTWTPDDPGVGTTGTFSITWDGPSPTGAGRGPMTVTGYTFDSENVFFAIGTGKAQGASATDLRIDNISITGTEVPEPGSLALLSLGGVLIAARRRRD